MEGDFNKEVKNWKHFSFDDPFQHGYGDETELEYRLSLIHIYMCIRDSFVLVPHPFSIGRALCQLWPDIDLD